jgi:hypothetical protein
MSLYEMGLPYNLVSFFGWDILMWFLPTIPRVPYWGGFFPEAPTISSYEQYQLKQKDIAESPISMF